MIKPALPIAYTFDEALEQAREVVAEVYTDAGRPLSAILAREGRYDCDPAVVRAMRLGGFRTYPNV